ncbi:39S ribosomal protein L13, mitochondrial [Gryllus bimaculatus]|nr:39S ribosomal protein L13, mitochondrial [Gryllus bimaculatus]
MSIYKRAQQWTTFTRVWHLFDAKWQNPFESAKIIQKYLAGLHKPIYGPSADTGDHVVVINSKEIALPGDEWQKRVYFHHTGFAGGASWTFAWELHEKDPTLVLKKAIYNSMKGNLYRHTKMERLHIYPDANVPKEILENVTNQIRRPRLIPKRLDEYSEEEVEKFPKLIDYPEDYVIQKIK